MKKSKRIIAVFLAVVSVVTFTACKSNSKISNEDERQKFAEFCEETARSIIEEDRLNAHFCVSDPKEYGAVFSEDDYVIGKMSVEDIKQSFTDMKKTYKELEKFNKDQLTKDQQVTYEAMEEYYEVQLMYEDNFMLQNIFGPNSGIVGNLSTTFIEYQFYDKEDIDEYLLYLEDTDRFMDDCFDFVREQSKEGYFMSDRLADQIIEQCEKYLDAEDDPVIASFNDKISQFKGLSDDEKEAYITKHEAVYKEHYLPVYQKTIDLLESLKGSGTNDGGLCNYGEKGEKFYEAVVKEKTSSQKTPEEIKEMLDDKMSDILKSITLITIKNPDIFEEGMYQPEFSEPEAVLESVIGKMNADFPEPVTTNYNIQYQNKACEIEGTVAYYVTCRIDDINVNNIKVNSSAVQEDRLTLYTTLSHEGYPGHLYEYTYRDSLENIPTAVKLLDFIGSSEGWAQYASNCALDYLDITEDEKEYIYLNDLFSYVLCSRVDIGVNYEGWDLKKTYSYLSNYIESDDDFSDPDNVVVGIYDSVIGDPGLYLPYTIGYMEMMDLRSQAEESLGDKFDAKEYHTWFLSLGIVPFDIYEKELDKWLTQEQ